MRRRATLAGRALTSAGASTRSEGGLVLRRWRLAAILLAGAVVFALVVDRHYPLGQWLFFHYARAAALAAVFALSCLVAGHAVVVRTLGRLLQLEEQVAVAFPLGVLVFFFASFAFGVAGLYGEPFFFLCPSLLLILGGRDASRLLARLRHHFGRLEVRISPGPLAIAALAFGCLGVLMVWFPILTPENASYDARWYHLPIAEHYVARGGIERFGEGWVPGALPQLSSLLYAWAFSAPGTLFDRVETAAHMEFALFLGTLAGVTAITRRVVGKRAPLAWAALFLFPGIFCYDSGLVLGADHVAALWAAPIFLLSLRYWEVPSNGHALLLGAVVAGALDTKYTAAMLVPLALGAVTGRSMFDVVRSRSLRPAIPALLVAASFIVLTSPHWLKNMLFYGDPLFPLGRAWLPSRPWSEAAELPFVSRFALRHPSANLAGLAEMAKTLVTFSFVPHDWVQYHGVVPVFGSLFTLLTPVLVFLGRRKRLHGLFLGTYLGVVVWFWTHEMDRYLQTLVPWMAAGTAAVLWMVWREGGAARFGVAGLVGFQIVWGGDVFFIPSHRAVGSTVARTVVDLLGRGYQKDYQGRFAPYKEWQAMAAVVPPGAKVLIHEEEIHFGLGSASALDYPGHQGLFYWGEPGASSPREVWKRLRDQGITHILWAPRQDHAADTVAGALAFFDFAVHHAKLVGTYGPFALAAMPEAPPPDEPPSEVAYYPCEGAAPFAPGLYPLTSMARWPGDRRPITRPSDGVTMEEAIGRARFLVFDARCRSPLSNETRARFELLAARGQSMMLARRSTPTGEAREIDGAARMNGPEGILHQHSGARLGSARASTSDRPHSSSGSCPLKTAGDWQSFLEVTADDERWAKTCSDLADCRDVVGGFATQVKTDVLAVLGACAKDVMDNPAVSRCTDRLRRFAAAWIQQHDEGSYGFTRNNHTYLSAQEAPGEPAGMMQPPPELLAAMPSRAEIEATARDNGWPYLTHDSCLGGTRTFLVIADREARFDQWMLINFGSDQTAVADHSVMSFLAVQKKDGNGALLPMVRLHFRDYQLANAGRTWKLLLDERLSGKCYACHSSGVRELIPLHGQMSESRPVRGEDDYRGSSVPPDYAFRRLASLNERLRSYGMPDWNGTIDPADHGPALGAGQGCTSCHDGTTRGVLTVSTSEGMIRQKIAEQLSMGALHDGTTMGYAVALVDRERSGDSPLSPEEKAVLEKARAEHRRDYEVFMAQRFSSLKDWLLENRCN